MPTLDEMLAVERRACPDTNANAWRERCEIYHYAKMHPEQRAARLALMSEKRPEHAEWLEQATTELRALAGTSELPASGRAEATRQAAAAARQAAATAPFLNPGTAWTMQHDTELVTKAQAGLTLLELSKVFGRPEKVLAQRLTRLGHPTSVASPATAAG